MKSKTKSSVHSRFQRQVNTLFWKSYLQRQRRWRLLLLEILFASVFLVTAIVVAKPVFMTPLQAVPEPPLTSSDIIASLNEKSLLGYAPDIVPYKTIMNKVSTRLGIDIMSGPTESDLNNLLYNRSLGTNWALNDPVTWVIWKFESEPNLWKFSIRSTERARYITSSDSSRSYSNLHLRSGFLAVQLAISEAILEFVSPSELKYELSLVSMPVSPLMQEPEVRKAISLILLCFTVALLPPVLEAESLVVIESKNRFKRALRLRNVDFSSIYLGWLLYAYLTVLPVSTLASITLIQIFRWIHVLYTFIMIQAYMSVIIMMALIMSLFHNNPWVAVAWTTMFTLMQTFLAELIIHHRLDLLHPVLTFCMHLLLPPLGLEHGFNEFALLQTGQEGLWKKQSVVFTTISWLIMNVIYFSILMVLQRTVKQKAIGGEVSWKSIIFKKIEDSTKLHGIDTPTGLEQDVLQPVDDLVAKAISMRNVSKSIMERPVLDQVTLDVYRGEFTMMYAERIQTKMMTVVEDLLVGLTYPDKGTINVLGVQPRPGVSLMTMLHMMGYCHRSEFLIDDLTVEEHLTFFISISLWDETNEFISEYSHIRIHDVLTDCDLDGVKQEYVRNLEAYYCAQLCFAIAVLLEPRIIIIPHFTGLVNYRAVIKDKIMRYKNHVTFIKISHTSTYLEYCDRLFIFDHQHLVFGGTPSYLFFKYGRDYRLRITFKNNVYTHEKDELLNRAAEAGGSVRADLGSLLILRIPTSPTAVTAKFVKELSENLQLYGIFSINISIPDSEEVCNRAIFVSRATSTSHTTPELRARSQTALSLVVRRADWVREQATFGNFLHLSYIGQKFTSFYRHYRLFFIITIFSALITGIFIGLSLSQLLIEIEKDHLTKRVLHGEILTVEALEQQTTLVLRTDNTSVARAIATAYVLSETGSTEKEVENMEYTALSHTESITEYLVTRAVDSPQHYVYMFAYGMDVSLEDEKIKVRVLYSPLHSDHGAAARSLARAYMALIRHYTNISDATIQVTDDPLALDLTPEWMKVAEEPPIFVQFLLILTISHMVLIPSMESGIQRHTQCYTINFSPLRYWFAMFICDLFLYWILVAVMMAAMITIMMLVAPLYFRVDDFVIVSGILAVYGLGCVPQAYIFSLGRRAALNSMIFVMVNIVFGETTVIAKIFYGNALDYMLNFLSFSPQFNIGYALVKIKKIFLYNNECNVFQLKNLCSTTTLHKCCSKCGVLQKCFSKKSYLSKGPGLIMEIIAMFTIAILFMTLLLLWEYKYIQRLCSLFMSKWLYPREKKVDVDMPGMVQEKMDVMSKSIEIQSKNQSAIKKDTFGEYLLASNVSRLRSGVFYVIRNASFGVGRGEALAISGQYYHGRLKLCELAAGYRLPTEGQLWSMSKWSINKNPYMYSRQISLCCMHQTLPHWMTVREALTLTAVLRGVPRRSVACEIDIYVNALALGKYADTIIEYLEPNERTRLNFAAAVIGAPPVVVLDECTAYQKFSAQRAMYSIIHNLRKLGHAILISSGSVESHMPVTNRMAIFIDGKIFDLDYVDNLISRYSDPGYTVVVHLKDDVEINKLFAKYFKKFHINDVTEVLANVQVQDEDLSWGSLFERMEQLQAQNNSVYSYVVSSVPIDYIYNSLICNEAGEQSETQQKSIFARFIVTSKPKRGPSDKALAKLMPLTRKYSITKLKELPWSVIFHR